MNDKFKSKEWGSEMKSLKALVICLLLSPIFTPLSKVVSAEVVKNEVSSKVKEVEQKLNVKSSEVLLDSEWIPKNNFISATDDKGKQLTWEDIEKEVKIEGKVDTKKLGTYKVVYEYKKITQEINVEVVKEIKSNLKLKEIKGKDITIYQNEAFDASQSFDKAISTDNKILDWLAVSKEVKVDNPVDTTKVGDYKVTYTEGKVETISQVSVVAKPTEIKVKNVFLTVGDEWSPEKNFDGILLSDKTTLDWSDVSSKIVVTGDSENSVLGEVVNTKKAGEYKVNFLYEGITATAKVTVKDKETPKVDPTVKSISLKNITLTVGDSWDASMNFNKVVMSDGKELAWKDISSEVIVTGNSGSNGVGQVINTDKVGTYQVDYLYKNVTSSTTVTVKAKVDPVVVTVKSIDLKDSAITVGDTWDASMNFNKILMSDGKELSWKDVSSEIIVTGNTGTTGEVVNTNKAGVYQVNYMYGEKTATATITVKEKEVVTVKNIELKDSTITVGGSWEPANNFVKVVMSDGKELAWQDVSSEIIVTGNTGTGVLGQVVNTQQVGTYEVSYMYKKSIATAKVTVVAITKPSSNNAKKVLPQTGEESRLLWVTLGIILLVGIFITFAYKLKKLN